jgi:dTMP kinase
MNVLPAESTDDSPKTGGVGVRGMLVCVDGPGGAGKSSVVAALALAGTIGGRIPLFTAEPTGDELGRLARSGVDRYRSYALACLVAADRHHHAATVLAPALVRGQLVISDRYVASSYVLQTMDGVESDFITAINAPAPRADLTVLLRAAPERLRDRIAARGTSHRFHDSPGAAERELSLYERTGVRLSAAGWDVVTIDTTATNAAHVANAVRALITDRLVG